MELPWHRLPALSGKGEDAFAGPAWFGEPDPDYGGEVTRSYWGNEALAEDTYLRRDGDESGTSFLIVGAYPDNTAQRDQQRPGTIDHFEALRRIAAVPAPAQDPVFGKGGPLVREWR